MKKLLVLLSVALAAVVSYALDTGVTVNGVDVGAGSGVGWTYYPDTKYVEVTGGGAYVLSGTNTEGKVMFAINDDAEITLSNLCLKCTTKDECCIWATNDVNVTLFLAGTNTLDASRENDIDGVGEGLCIENGTRLMITNAPGFADEDAVLIAVGSCKHAAIAVGRNGTEGAKPYFEIAGGTVYANWFGSHWNVPSYSCGIGSSHTTGKVGDADIVISGGRVFARGGTYDPGIGADFENTVAPDIRISGGYVEAVGNGNAAGIGGGKDGRYGNVTISGGTVVATGGYGSPDLISGWGDKASGGRLIISGGSVVPTNLWQTQSWPSVKPLPCEASGTSHLVWCVTVEGLGGLGGLVSLEGLGDYGTDDICVVDGKICLWLPNGTYEFDVRAGGKTFRYETTVNGANVTATKVGQVFGVTINGRDAGLGPDGESGWTLQDGTNVVLDGTRDYLLSGANADDLLTFTAANGATVKFDGLALSSAGTIFTVGEGKTLTVAPKAEGSVMALAGAVDGRMSVTGGRIDLGASSVKDLEVLDGTVSQDAFAGDTAVINGGSVKVADLTVMNPAPRNCDGAPVWCVTMPVDAADGTQVTLECMEVGFELPANYGSQNLFALDGHLYLWLPNGTYKYNADFGYGPIPYTVTVSGAHAEAVVDTSRYTGVTVNGRDTGLGEYSGCGWKRTADKYVELDGTVGSYVISGSNDVGNVMIAIAGDANVTLSNLYLKCKSIGECCIWATNGTTVALSLAGVNTLDARGAAVGDNMGEGLCIENGTRLTITNAPGFADEDAVLVAKGSFNRAAIAVGRNGAEGEKPYFEIAGGTVYANWFDSPATWSAGIGASYKTGKNGEANIVISGGCVFAKGGYGDPGIGAADYENGVAPDIRISGGYVEAVGGVHAAGIGGGTQGKYGSVTVSGGTVIATGGTDASDMLAGYDNKGGDGFTVTGGSVVLTRGQVNPAPSNGTDRVWCVTVTNIAPYAAVTLTGITTFSGYGTNDLFADGDGKVCLWLPDGPYDFTLNCGCGDLHYTATVAGANTFAKLDESQLSGLKINGRWMLFGPAADDGWEFAGATLSLTGAGKTYSITNTAESWNGSIDVLADSTVVLEGLKVDASSGNAMRIGNGVSAELRLSGSSTLISHQWGYAALCVHYGSSLVITNAPDAAVAELHASTRSQDGAAIGGNSQRNCGDITIAGGRIYATSNFRSAGIGGGAQSNGSTGTIRIMGGYVEATGGDYGGSGIGSGRRFSSVGKNAPPVIISGGTVKATGRLYWKTGGWGADIGRGLNNTGGSVTITGGSVLAVNDRVNPAPTADGKRVWCVTVECEGIESQGSGIVIAGLDGYGTKDVEPVDGKIYLWLPNGNYGFTVGGEKYAAAVKDADTTAVRGASIVGVTVDGVDVGFGSGEGWRYDGEKLFLTNATDYALSGGATNNVYVDVQADATVTIADLTLVQSSKQGWGEHLHGMIIFSQGGQDARLLLAGTNRLESDSNGPGCGVNVAGNSKLTIDNAPGCSGVLLAKGGWYSAGIGGYCSGNGEIVIDGGDITVQGGSGSAGLGSGYWNDAPHANGPISINGGHVTAKGSDGACSIGCPKNRNSGGDIRITGGTVVAKQGIGASISGGAGCTNTFTGGSISVEGPLNLRPTDADGRTVWCVTVECEGIESQGSGIVIAGLDGYGTKDVEPVDGKIYLWLPNGNYGFTVGGIYYLATVKDANTKAIRRILITPGTPSEPFATAEMATNAASVAVVNPRGDVTVALGSDEARQNYCNMFGFAVTGGGEAWSVEAVLTPEAWTNVIESAQEATRQIPVADIAALPPNTSTNVTVKGCGVPGFFYTFYSGSTVTNVEVIADDGCRDVLCGADKKVDFSGVMKPSDAAGFFSIGVQDAPTVRVDEED